MRRSEDESVGDVSQTKGNQNSYVLKGLGETSHVRHLKSKRLNATRFATRGAEQKV